MTEPDREALLERAGIMEYDAGLDRREATLQAFALYYPEDYQSCMNLIAGNPTRETYFYEWLEGLLKPSITLEKGSILSAETEKVIPHAQAPEDATTGQETPPRVTGEIPADLNYIISQGIALIGVYDSGAMIAKQETENFTTDPQEIMALMAGKGDTQGRAQGTPIERFYFIPADYGLLCLDIDRKNGKDGIEEFYAWAEQVGKPRQLLPRVLQDIPHNFPCYVSTPSGGYHLYFSYTGGKVQKKPLSPDTPGVEVKHGAPGLTSPGSYKNGLPYSLHGKLENAPPLPAFILTTMEPPKSKPIPYISQTHEKKEWGKPSWDKIREWTDKDGAGVGRNDRAFNLARHARNHGYTENETLDAIKRDMSIDGLPEKEIETSVHSAFKRRRTA